MDIADALTRSGALDAAARELGISPAVASAGAAALLPAILGGFKGQAQSHPDGLSGLGGLLGTLGGGSLLDAVVGPQATPVDQGNGVLAAIFGNRDVSRTVADHASRATGIDSETLQRLLPIVAMLVAGYLARQAGGEAAAPPAPAPAPVTPAGGGLGGGLGGVLGDVLGSVLGGGRTAPAAPAAPAGAGGLASILDLDGDGNPLNDIIGMAGRLRG